MTLYGLPVVLPSHVTAGEEDLCQCVSLDSPQCEQYSKSAPNPDFSWLVGSAVEAYQELSVDMDDSGIEVCSKSALHLFDDIY